MLRWRHSDRFMEIRQALGAERERIMDSQYQSGTKPPDIVPAMLQRSFYPHQPPRVELKQTHISYVFLAGQYVYKVKKPLAFPFLNYSMLADRLHFCREEVRLNRRLAPAVYLDVLPILVRGNQLTLGEGTTPPGSEVVEYAVKMRRLPEAQMLDRLIAEGSVKREQIRAIARKLASFHQVASVERSSEHGTWQAIQSQTGKNLNEIEPFSGRTIHPKLFEKIKRYNDGFLSANKELIERRLRDHKVCEGHGDLRAEHVCMTDDIDIFDCIEFNEAFRYCDVASEIAFLTMDLDFLHARELSDQLRDDYADRTEDEDLKQLVSFYKCYRACVRGKVDTLKSLDQEVPQKERQKASSRARRYFRLAHRYARPEIRSGLILVCGMIATGKSTLAGMLEDVTGFRLKSSDIVRKGLAQAAPQRRFSDDYGKGIYGSAFSDRTYDALLGDAQKILSEGKGIIIDASFKDAKHRLSFLKEAESRNVPILFVECQAGQDEIFRRLKARQKQTDQPSDATWETYLQQRREYTPLTDVPDPFHLRFDGATEFEDLVARIQDLFAATEGCA